MKKQFKLLALSLVIIMMVPLCLACGGGSGTDTTTTAADTTATTEAETTTEAPTEPTTPRPTDPPTEAPTDPAERPEPDGLGIVEGFRYYLKSLNSNLYLENYSKRSGGSPTQEAFTGKTPQMFVFEPQGDDIYKIKSLNSNCYVDIAYVEGETLKGKYVEVTETPAGEGTQLWKIIKNEDESYSIASTVGFDESPLGMTVKSASTDEGGEIIAWGGYTAKNQKWILELVADRPDDAEAE